MPGIWRRFQVRAEVAVLCNTVIRALTLRRGRRRALAVCRSDGITGLRCGYNKYYENTRSVLRYSRRAAFRRRISADPACAIEGGAKPDASPRCADDGALNLSRYTKAYSRAILTALFCHNGWNWGQSPGISPQAP